VFFASADPPHHSRWKAIRYERNFYNWHYACAKAFIDGTLSIKQDEVAANG
jgi:hypothetical protein